MSHVTSVVVVMPGLYLEEYGPNDEDNAKALRLGRLMKETQFSRELEPNDRYWPIPDQRIGDRWLSDGGKVPGGVIWWLGLNGARMDELIKAVTEAGEFDGTTIWYQSESEEFPTTVVINSKAEDLRATDR